MSRLPTADRGNELTTIAGGRLSKCQECRLETEVSRSDRLFSSRHPSLVEALDHANGNLRHCLRLLESQGLVEIGRSPQGQAEMSGFFRKVVRRPLKLQKVLIKEYWHIKQYVERANFGVTPSTGGDREYQAHFGRVPKGLWNFKKF